MCAYDKLNAVRRRHLLPSLVPLDQHIVRVYSCGCSKVPHIMLDCSCPIRRFLCTIYCVKAYYDIIPTTVSIEYYCLDDLIYNDLNSVVILRVLE